MKRKKTANIQISAAIIMALLGSSLCRFSQSYISIYDRPLVALANESSRETASGIQKLPTQAEKSQETPAPYVPSLTALNLAFLYGEGDSQEKSLGTEAAEALSLKDSAWLASLYQLANKSPQKVAASLGMPSASLKDLSFEKVDITFYDEKGKQISPRSNIQEIMSMANTYFYYTAPEDYDAFLNYANQLWENSHSFQYSISDIYYCDGSLEGNLAESSSAKEATPSQAEKAEPPETSEAMESPSEDSSQVIYSNKTDSAKEIGPGIALKESETVKEDPQPTEPAETSAENLCPGHVDLHVKAVIAGLSDTKKGLFSLDTIGNAPNDAVHWPGWTEETKNSAINLANQDWTEAYGLTLTPSFITNPLSYEEIDHYMDRLPEHLSENRRKVIHYALSSVGRVPYYWGGKPASADYEKNHFGALVTPDEKGRAMKGLDCSGWISWVYWSAINKRLSSESTSGLASVGTAIHRNDLQPGDIILKTGEEGHVVMFLCWESDGSMTVIHESSALVNNVTVTTMSANWPYYRKLID
ncbi:C40 family peptidase [Lacrimispora sp. JR3]|uniref:C40 family peptidase n=1 Tax=Lacrimispora sinapis TaxID=3111456 RepID=UPI0037478655